MPSAPDTIIAGLSPRVRGNHNGGGGLRAGIGSIPACAGEPTRVRPLSGRAKVYPRVCGGTASSLTACPMPWGLSPRVRGNR